MPGRLRRVPFEPSMLGAAMVRGFDCGPEPWAAVVTTWLKAGPGEGGAADAVELDGNRVWLYLNEAGVLVGVGSVGAGSLKWPDPKKSKPVLTTVVPMLGVDHRHRGAGCGREVMAHLLYEAKQDAAERPLMHLCVDAENPAVGFYQRHGFVQIGGTYLERESRRPHFRMALELTGPASG